MDLFIYPNLILVNKNRHNGFLILIFCFYWSRLVFIWFYMSLFFLLKAILTFQFSILTYKNHSITFYLQGVDWMNDSDFHSLFIRET